jgi:hypothetical protein
MSRQGAEPQRKCFDCLWSLGRMIDLVEGGSREVDSGAVFVFCSTRCQCFDLLWSLCFPYPPIGPKFLFGDFGGTQDAIQDRWKI